MNYYKACNILNLTEPLTYKMLKHNYYLMALRFHPDKNPDIEAKTKFQNILDAYTYLSTYIGEIEDINQETNIDSKHHSYINILEQFISGMLEKNIDINKFLPIVNNKYTDLSIKFLKQLPKITLMQLYKFINQYGELLNINTEVINKLNELVGIRTKNDTIINLTPSLENLINDEIYKVCHKEEIYYIPLWHHELIYDLSDNSLIIQCEPSLPDYISLDQYNNLYVNLSTTIHSILNQDTITINIANKQYILPISELYIKKYQVYTFKNIGIALVNTKNIYDIENRGNIYVNIHLTDIVDKT